jgi:hypothetical protein
MSEEPYYETLYDSIRHISKTFKQVLEEYGEDINCLPGEALEGSGEEVQKPCDFENLIFYKYENILELYNSYKNSMNMSTYLDNVASRLDITKRIAEPEELTGNPEYNVLDGEYIYEYMTEQDIINDVYIMYKDYIPSGTLEESTSETFDYLSEFYICLLPQYENIVHAVQIPRIFNYDSKTQKFLINTTVSCWWTKNFVGQADYMGGWFTYKTSYGGPKFGLELTYSLEQSIPVLFIPPIYAKQLNLENTDYFDIKGTDLDILKRYNDRGFSGSHLIQGVSGWKGKNYKKILRPTDQNYADNLAKKLTDLNIYGYISCDECEIFLSHVAMKKFNLKKPIEMNLNEEKVRTQIFNASNSTQQKQITEALLNELVLLCSAEIPIQLEITELKTRQEQYETEWKPLEFNLRQLEEGGT